MTVNKVTAAYSGSVDLVNFLLSRGANPNAIKVNEGVFSRESIDPMLKALQEGHIEAAKILMAHWQPD